MPFQDAMNTMLPPINSNNRTINPHVTSQYGVWRSRQNRRHNAIDFNYTGGRHIDYNNNHPQVFSPVSGTVVATGGRWGMVIIRDSKGYQHKILHLDSQTVKKNQVIDAGTQIGTMGNTGTTDMHVHYQILDSRNNVVNPKKFWEEKTPVIPKKNRSAQNSSIELDNNNATKSEPKETAEQVALQVHERIGKEKKNIELALQRQQSDQGVGASV